MGVVSAARLEALYGVPIGDASLLVLMRHRAVMLGIVAALIAGAAFRPAWRPIALAAGFVSMVSFIALAVAGGELNPEVRRVAVVDLGLCAALAGAAAIDARAARAAA